ncbi:hypothetical protein BGZ60DRAFT_401313 [Tricladium varicosporioides]|nr:hypothetical protein BGZ60DRAFT_401313 [Hymenoscyphus varicosporioides]
MNDTRPSRWGITKILSENYILLNNVEFQGHNNPDILEVESRNLSAAEKRDRRKYPIRISTTLDTLP